MPNKIYPTIESRIKQWEYIYKSQGQRWADIHSLASNFAMSDIFKYGQKDGMLLDIGCGYGRDLYIFQRFFDNMELYGIDAAFPKDTFLMHRNKITYFQSNLFDFNSEKKFDIIYLNYFIHLFFNGEIHTIMDIISSITKVGSLVILNFVSKEDIHFKKNKIDSNICVTDEGIYWRCYNEEEIWSLFENSCFKIITMQSYDELELNNSNLDPVKSIYVAALKE